jgi:hypothetical protein
VVASLVGLVAGIEQRHFVEHLVVHGQGLPLPPFTSASLGGPASAWVHVRIVALLRVAAAVPKWVPLRPTFRSMFSGVRDGLQAPTKIDHFRHGG